MNRTQTYIKHFTNWQGGTIHQALQHLKDNYKIDFEASTFLYNDFNRSNVAYRLGFSYHNEKHNLKDFYIPWNSFEDKYRDICAKQFFIGYIDQLSTKS